MLLQPFIGAWIALRAIAWPVLPALAAIVLMFLLREPLLALARQYWVWRTPHAEVGLAKRQLAWQVPSLLIAGALLAIAWPLWIVAVMGLAAVALTGLTVWMTIRNRQREVWFQVLSSAALSSTCVLACLGLTGQVPVWGWWWWGLHAAHFLAGIVVVHVRLEARILARRNLIHSWSRMDTDAYVVQGLLLAGAVGLAVMREWFYSGAMLLSGAVHLRDLYTAYRPASVAMPMMVVGRRALAVSIVFTLLLVAGVWVQI